MKAEYVLDKSFGPAGSTAGVIVFIAGLAMVYFHFTGLILVVVGAFVGFSTSSAILDYDQKRIRFSNNIFGIIKTGKWMLVDPTMKVGLKKSNRAYRAYSQGNRTTETTLTDFRVYICDAGNREIMEVRKCNSPEEASKACDTIAVSLDLRNIKNEPDAKNILDA
jgi:hypothetical protein